MPNFKTLSFFHWKAVLDGPFTQKYWIEAFEFKSRISDGSILISAVFGRMKFPIFNPSLCLCLRKPL